MSGLFVQRRTMSGDVAKCRRMSQNVAVCHLNVAAGRCYGNIGTEPKDIQSQFLIRTLEKKRASVTQTSDRSFLFE